MGLYEDLLARAQPGGFPAIPVPPIDPIEEAAQAQAAREAAALRTRRGVVVRDAPPLPEGSMVPFGALGAGMMPPTAPPEPMASGSIAPQFDGPVPLPRERPKEADGAAVEVARSPGMQAPEGDSAIPPNAAPTSSIPPSMPVAAPPAAAPEQPSIFGRLMSGLHNNSATLLALGAGFAGAPNIGQGISRAASAAIPASQADMKTRMMLDAQKQSYAALIGMKVPPNEALAAVSNPDMMKAIIAKYAEAQPYQHVTTTDSLGNQKVQAFKPSTGEFKDIGGTASDTGLGAAAKLTPNYDPVTKRDEAFLSALDPLTASAVKDIADGKLPGTGRNLQKLMPLVARYENGFEGNTYQARQNLQKSYYGGGEGAKALRSANTTIDHGIQLQKAIDDLHNYSVLPGFLNATTGAVSKQFDKKYQDALARFKANSQLYAKELDVALTGKSTVSGQKHIMDMFDENGSPVANKAALQQTLEMLDQRVSEHENTYKTGMNKHGAVFSDMLTQRDKLKNLLGQDTGAGTHAPVAPAGKTSTGVQWSIVQ